MKEAQRLRPILGHHRIAVVAGPPGRGQDMVHQFGIVVARGGAPEIIEFGRGSACSGSQTTRQMEKSLADTLKQYETIIRWSQWDAAVDFIAPEYIQERIGSLETLVGLLTDPVWDMPPEDRPRVIETLAYFAETNDLIPDEIPGLGFLDDAFMIDIVCRDFEDEIEAYRDFCVHRITEAQATGRDALETDGAEWMAHRRRQLHLRKHLSRKERQS